MIESEAQRRITARWIVRYQQELSRPGLSATERAALESHLAALIEELDEWDAARRAGGGTP